MARLCSKCSKPMNSGWFCCDNYYCSEHCLVKGSGVRNMAQWEAEHYTEDGDCYFTEWDDLGDRETLETAALIACSPDIYYELCDNLGETSDDELRAIIKAKGDTDKENEIAKRLGA